MSKLNSSKINFENSNFLVEVSSSEENTAIVKQEDLIINRAQAQAQKELSDAKNQANKIIKDAKSEIEQKKQEIIEQANSEANNILENAKNEAQKILDEANEKKEQILKEANTTAQEISQKSAKKGYEEGYRDSEEKFIEENQEKLNKIDEFCSKKNIIQEKIFKNAINDIISVVNTISKKIIFKIIDADILEKIILSTVSLFEDKENIKVILSENYAKILSELNKDKFENIDIVFNKEFDKDTIIIENLKERFDASVNQQIDVIIREVFDKTNNDDISIKEYCEKINETD